MPEKPTQPERSFASLRMTGEASPSCYPEERAPLCHPEERAPLCHPEERSDEGSPQSLQPAPAAQLAVVLSYKGADFSGFARQPGQRTVQGCLEQAFSLALRRPVETVCAGRTDAGVHARAQVVSFPVTAAELSEHSLPRLERSFQALTDDDISIQSLACLPVDFSARFSAIEREYRYLVVPEARRPLFLHDWAWDVRRPLDAQAMDAAGKLLLGEHDFKSFCMAVSAEGKNTVRELTQVDVLPVNILGEDALSIRVTGNAFLHSMVRTIVGTLVAVGSGRRPVEWVGEVLEARDRRAAGETAPAQGLVFWRVSYPDGIPAYEAPTPAAFVPTAEDVVRAEATIAALEHAEEDGLSSDLPTTARGHANSVPLPTGPLPTAVEAAVNAPAREGSVRRNEPTGPAVPAAERTHAVAPADPQPAEGEVSFTFEVPRDSAAARAAKSQKEQSRDRRRKGPFSGLFGKGSRA